VPRSLLILLVLITTEVPLLAACSVGGEAQQEFSEDGISFRYPRGWHVVGFSTSNSPHRLAVSSYRVPRTAIEGDCGGYEAVELLPATGAIVLLIDYGEGGSFAPLPDGLRLSDGDFAEYECFGASTMFRFLVEQRDLQAHLAVGSQASEKTRDRALAILSDISATDIP
jgi:hypothetical protein